MGNFTVALFGEAEKGEYRTAYFCHSLPQLVDNLGNPPPESKGLYYAVQTLLYHRDLIFFRVREEGFSMQDYLLGLRLLQAEDLISTVSAFCIPGAGNSEIIHALTPVCAVHHSLLIISECDLYDYLTEQVA